MSKVNVTGMRIFDEDFNTKRISPDIFLEDIECYEIYAKMAKYAKSLTKWSEILLAAIPTEGVKFQISVINDRLLSEGMDMSIRKSYHKRLILLEKQLEEIYEKQADE